MDAPVSSTNYERLKRLVPVPLRNLVRRVPRVMTAPCRALPDFLVIGVQKGGTTSLYRYLIEHPQVAAAQRKEVRYFDHKADRSLWWYRAHFPLQPALRCRCPQLTFEASPGYLFDPASPARVQQVLPEAKLIALLRHPVDRLYAQFQMAVRRGRRSGTLEAQTLLWDCIDMPRSRWTPQIKVRKAIDAFCDWLPRGTYAPQLAHWFRHFPREQLLVLNSEQFFADPQATLDGVTDFLGLDRHRWSSFEVHHKGHYAPMKPESRRRLLDFFREPNEELYDLIGRRFAWEE